MFISNTKRNHRYAPLPPPATFLTVRFNTLQDQLLLVVLIIHLPSLIMGIQVPGRPMLGQRKGGHVQLPPSTSPSSSPANSTSNNNMINLSPSNITGGGNKIIVIDHDDENKVSPPSSASRKLSTSSASFRIMLLALMVLQNSSVVLVGRYTRSSTSEKDMFVVSQLILITEVAKLVGAAIFEWYGTNGQLFRSLKENIIKKPFDSLKVSIPAMLYLLQNSLLYLALSNLSAPLFQVTYQSKILTTAIVSVILLKRKYTFQQWLCLATLGIGVAIVVLGEKSTTSSTVKATSQEDGSIFNSAPGQNMLTGLIAVLIACFSSAFAGVYFEMVLKKPDGGGKKPVSLWMRNMQLAFFSIVVALGQNLHQQFGISRVGGNGGNGSTVAVTATSTTEAKPFLHGFTFWVWILVVLQAGGGLLIAAIIKYADNVLKGLATGVAVAVSTLCSMVLFGTPLTVQFACGGTLILASVYFFSSGEGCGKKEKETNNDPAEGVHGEVSSSEMKPILVPV